MNCTVVKLGQVINCNGTLYEVEVPPLSYQDMWFWIYLSIYVVLVLFAGKLLIILVIILRIDYVLVFFLSIPLPPAYDT